MTDTMTGTEAGALFRFTVRRRLSEVYEVDMRIAGDWPSVEESRLAEEVVRAAPWDSSSLKDRTIVSVGVHHVARIEEETPHAD